MYPTLLRLGEYHLSSYRTLLFFSFLLCGFLTIREARRVKLDPAAVFDFLVIIAIASLFGARLFYGLLEMPRYYLQHPLKLFDIGSGGFVFFGGVVFGITAGVLFARRRGLPLGRVFDAGAPAFALSLALGRMGCFLAGCCFGKACELGWPLTVTFPIDVIGGPSPKLHGLPVMPTQVYSSLMGLCLFAFLLYWRPRKRFHGELFCAFLLLYSVGRFLLEFTRSSVGRAPYLGGWLSTSQLYAVVIFLVAAAIVLINRRGKTKVAI